MVILVSCLISGLIAGSFALGYYFRDKKEKEEGVHFNKNNKDFLVEMAKWANYNGKQ